MDQRSLSLLETSWHHTRTNTHTVVVHLVVIIKVEESTLHTLLARQGGETEMSLLSVGDSSRIRTQESPYLLSHEGTSSISDLHLLPHTNQTVDSLTPLPTSVGRAAGKFRATGR